MLKKRGNGLKASADDYLSKLFDFDELLARAIALGHRYNPASLHASLEVGAVILDPESRLAYCAGSELTLTKLELGFLLYLAQNLNKMWSRERI